jgi:hypothetical protein
VTLTCTGSSSPYGSSYDPGKACDGNSATAWIYNSSTSGKYVQAGFTSSYVASVTFSTLAGYATTPNFTVTWNLSGNNAGTSGSLGGIAGGGTRTVSIGAQVDTIRLTWDANQTSGYDVPIAEIGVTTGTAPGSGSDPTASPWPKTSPSIPPSAPPPTGGTDQCMHGHVDSLSGIAYGVWQCSWKTAGFGGGGTAISFNDFHADWVCEPGSRYTTGGFDNMYCDHPVTATSGVLVHSATQSYSDGSYGLGTPVCGVSGCTPTTVKSIRVHAEVGQGGTFPGGSQQICLEVGMYWLDGTAFTSNVVGTRKGGQVCRNSSAGYPMGPDFTFDVPTGARAFQPVVFCEGTCPSPSGIQVLFLTMVMTGYSSLGGQSGTPVDCTQAGFCGGHTGDEPGTVYEPGDGTLTACAPLSGDKTKPCIAYNVIALCVAPSDALNVPGWLSYIACELANIPPRIFNLLIWLVDALIDLAVPGAALAAIWQEFVETMTAKAPFGWIAQVVGALQTAFATAPGGSLGSSLTFHLFGRNVTVSASLTDQLADLAVYRGYFVAAVWLLTGLQIARLLRSTFAGGPA